MAVPHFEALLSGHEIAAVYFWSKNCGKCKLLGPRIESVIKQKGITLHTVDIGAEQEIALHYDVLSLPTLIFFRTGREELRLTPADISIAAVESACETFTRDQHSGPKNG